MSSPTNFLQSIVGFNVSLLEFESVRSQSEVSQESVRSQSRVSQESVRSQSGVNQESVRSQSGVCQESVRSMMLTKFGELIWTALQIETWGHLQQIS